MSQRMNRITQVKALFSPLSATPSSMCLPSRNYWRLLEILPPTLFFLGAGNSYCSATPSSPQQRSPISRYALLFPALGALCARRGRFLLALLPSNSSLSSRTNFASRIGAITTVTRKVKKTLPKRITNSRRGRVRFCIPAGKDASAETMVCVTNGRRGRE